MQHTPANGPMRHQVLSVKVLDSAVVELMHDGYRNYRWPQKGDSKDSKPGVQSGWCASQVRGATAHFDAVVGAATSGVLSAGLDAGVPVIFCVMTTDTMEQVRHFSSCGKKKCL